MRTLITVHYFDPHVGGMEEVAKKQALSLVAEGYEVDVLTCRPRSDVPLREVKDGYTVHRLRALNSIENKFGVTFPLISPFALFGILRRVRRANIVHIHDVFYMSSHLTMIAATLLKKPVYLTQHVAMVDHPSPLVMLVQRLVYGTFGRFIFSGARSIICYNTNVRDFLLEKGVSQEKILLHYNGIDTTFFSPVGADTKEDLRKKYDLKTDKPVVLFVGRLVPKKGYEIVFNAQDVAYQTLIVGTGEIPARMKDASNVRFFGTATPSQLKELYQLSDVFVFPAIGEILTLVMQEAMACGLPVITTNDPAYEGYAIDSTKLKLVPRTMPDVQSAIKEVLSSKQLQKEMSVYSRHLAESRFSWDKNFHEELALYPKERAA